MPIELKVPSVGESITEVQIGQWLKAEGDSTEKDQPLVEIESDKATVELVAPESGRVAKVLKHKGETATVGEVIGYLEETKASGGEEGERNKEKGESEADGRQEGERSKEKGESGQAAADEGAKQKAGRRAAQAAPRAPGGAAAPRSDKSKETGEEGTPGKERKPSGEAEAKKATDRQGERKQEGQEASFVMPAAARALAEHGLAAADVSPSGPGGRLLKEDVERHAAAQPPAPKTDTSEVAPQTPAGDVDAEIVPMSPLRRRVAQRLVEAQQTAALLTTFNEIDLSAVIDLRTQHRETFQQKHGVKLGFMSFFVKAAIEALKQVPQLNAEIRGTNVVYYNRFDIGIAVGGGKGLVVPVLRGADHMSFADIERTIEDFGRRAKENKIKLEELQGGTFTISNGGIYGSLLSTPIVNPPQSGILGMHAIQERPVAHEGQVVIRPMMYVALTYDHRLVDGREAVLFLRHVKELVEEPAAMLLEV